MQKGAFELRGNVDSLLIANDAESAITKEVEEIEVVLGYGITGDRHSGKRYIDSREDEMKSFGFPKGMEIANHREFSAISIEEHCQISESLNLPGGFLSGLLGENIIFYGIPELSKLPPQTMIFFQNHEGVKRTAVLVVRGENLPCKVPGEAIANHLDNPGLAAKFPKAAYGRRGIVGSIYSSGKICLGDVAIFKIPKQRIYDPK